MKNPQGIAELRAALLAWYDRHARTLPWRTPPGDAALPDPYRVWLSEIMLQQTTVPHAAPYFERFVARWPSVEALAEAERDEVLAAWAGLGYYARARNLHACARAVAEAGGFPQTVEALKRLPGIGDYTSAAVGAIAFDAPAVPVDGNVERVLARLFAVETPLPKAKPEIRGLAAQLAAETRPGDFAQALMDLGATVCTPAKPACALCPWREACAAFAAGSQESYPRRAPRTAKPARRGVAFWMARGNAVLLRRQPDDGLLGGMWLPPSTPWREAGWETEEAAGHAPAATAWERLDAEARHVFTHFSLSLEIWRAPAPKRFAPAASERFVPLGELDRAGLPSVGRKVWKLAEAG